MCHLFRDPENAAGDVVEIYFQDYIEGTYNRRETEFSLYYKIQN